MADVTQQGDVFPAQNGFLSSLTFCLTFLLVVYLGLILTMEAGKEPESQTALTKYLIEFCLFPKKAILLLTSFSKNSTILLDKKSVEPGLILLSPMILFTVFLLIAAGFGLRWEPNSFYYIGFLFTLASLFAAFGSYDSSTQAASTLTAQMADLLGKAGGALTTTFAGLILRYVVVPVQNSFLRCRPFLFIWRPCCRFLSNSVQTGLKALGSVISAIYDWLTAPLRWLGSWLLNPRRRQPPDNGPPPPFHGPDGPVGGMPPPPIPPHFPGGPAARAAVPQSRPNRSQPGWLARAAQLFRQIRSRNFRRDGAASQSKDGSVTAPSTNSPSLQRVEENAPHNPAANDGTDHDPAFTLPQADKLLRFTDWLIHLFPDRGHPK